MPLPWQKSHTTSSGGRVTTNMSTSNKSRRLRIFLSYAPDWALTIVLWGIFYLLDKINGYRRLFDVTDTSLAHPHADPERVPVWLLAVLCGVVPAVIIIFTAAIRRSFWDAQSALLGLILGLGLVATFTNIVKITVGRPRPDFFARCILPEDLTANPLHGLTSWTVCTQPDDSVLQEGFRSFPSGHSSFAWSGMWYLILYLAAKMRINNRSGYTYKSWLLLAPLSCASLITISRTMDYRHHATDVIAGSLIGIIGAWYSYRQYYPPIGSPQSYKPYSPRIPKDEEIPLHHRPTRSSMEGMLNPHSQTADGSHHHPSGSSGDTVNGQPPIGHGMAGGAGSNGFDRYEAERRGDWRTADIGDRQTFGSRGGSLGQAKNGVIRGQGGHEEDGGDYGEGKETVQRPIDRTD
ncbi:uncharacterized protein I303_106870 [Kwoniella dejecticola CBS 10117]|uniref:Phosphatidic acid phosphatase type 2/haloperoxidase domain-containing protein n=1 Tax=Kwoniella dejecticola CBS 10117 TaxID=1296121 RepID=A0A1A5ZTG2_9TREE|nr:uncharacterized protein I303_08490 [Kwoniella dejecticola CBS 10117]OBR81108.1 hypothetical protein I303_08490 [Kwoniella dejecticola CBS 10117]